MVDKNIIEFWDWFTANSSNLNSDKISNMLINELNNRILLLGDYNWEIREGNNKPNMLIISPGGDINLLESTKKIVSLSPALMEWEFYYYKPEKKWNYQFSIEDDDGVKRMVNATDWEYVLLKFDDGTYDIIIKADSLKTLSEQKRLTAVDIVLESILGEEISLLFIKNIEIVEGFSGEYFPKKNTIKFLREHIKELEHLS